MIKLFIIIAALMIFVVGAITAPTPIPIGVPLMALSLFMLISVSNTARRAVKRARYRWERLDGWIIWLEDRAKGKVGDTLKNTRPRRRKPGPRPPKTGSGDNRSDDNANGNA
ncbi:hypothetical protein [Cucumibacter marinus]|uniref:hypothetical protein n=1 Tax=Cucumibacter marinus TaxID=1121252 RepID=UPI0003F4CC27|nr:hypothetical protein [Cucumibacter marinus]